MIQRSTQLERAGDLKILQLEIDVTLRLLSEPGGFLHRRLPDMRTNPGLGFQDLSPYVDRRLQSRFDSNDGALIQLRTTEESLGAEHRQIQCRLGSKYAFGEVASRRRRVL